MSFEVALRDHGIAPLRRSEVTTLQANITRRCNLACHHCHVESSPKRGEAMSRRTIERLLELLEASPAVEVLDLTGGAPELHPDFRFLVRQARSLGRQVIDRCNLTVFQEPGQADTPEFLAQHGVAVVASLPCYKKENVEQQRGRRVFDPSIAALRRLNALGYGRHDSELRLDLIYNPVGASLPGPQAELEREYRHELAERFGIEFHRLLTLTNMPIRRFAEQLARQGRQQEYMCLLVQHFNPATVRELMCRRQVSVDHAGRLFDCDFNLALELPLGAASATIWDLARLDGLRGAPVRTAEHCFGCTAGAGSSCGGALTSRGRS